MNQNPIMNASKQRAFASGRHLIVPGIHHMDPDATEGPPLPCVRFPARFPERKDAMTSAELSPVTRWRMRRRRQGFVRVEVQVRKEDAVLVREVTTALVDPEREAETRAILREKISAPCSGGLKALLASAPLEGVDLERQRDLGRDAAL